MRLSGSAAARPPATRRSATASTRLSDHSGGAALLRRLALLLPLAVLAACSGNQTDSTAPACPKVSILGDAQKAVQFRPGPGRDATDVIYEIEIAGIGSGCEFARKNASVTVTTNIGIAASRGPAAQGDLTGVANYFVAIVDRQQNILRKEVFDAAVKLPVGTRRAGTGDQTVQTIPLGANVRSSDFEVLVGLQLSEEQLRWNRQASQRR